MNVLTIGKRLFRIVCFVLTGVLLTACEAEPQTLNPLEQLSSSVETETSVPSSYRLILPYDCSAELSERARAVARNITEQTEVSAEVVYEYEVAGAAEGEIRIWIGWVRTAESLTKMKSLRANDYLCRWSKSGSLVLGGKTDQACMAALDRFCTEILPAANRTTLLHPQGGFSFTADYAVDTVTLNGFDLREYRIVCSENESNAAYALATALRDRIAEKSGYVLSVISEAENEKSIVFQTERLEDDSRQTAGWRPLENGIALFATDDFGLSVIAKRFCERLLTETSPGNCACSVEQQDVMSYACEPYALASVAIEHFLPFSSQQQVTALTDVLYVQSPDGVLFAPMTAGNFSYIQRSLSSYQVPDAPGTSALYAATTQMTVESAERLDAYGLTVVVCRIGRDDNGFRVVHVSGCLTNDWQLRLSDWLNAEEEPTVVIAHWAYTEQTLSVAEAETTGWDTVVRESFTASGQKYGFSCYADLNRLSVELTETTDSHDAVGYREVRVLRKSAF